MDVDRCTYTARHCCGDFLFSSKRIRKDDAAMQQCFLPANQAAPIRPPSHPATHLHTSGAAASAPQKSSQSLVSLESEAQHCAGVPLQPGCLKQLPARWKADGAEGCGPERKLSEKSAVVREGRVSVAAGSGPASWLPATRTEERSGREETSGKAPAMLLRDKSRVIRRVEPEREGMVPENWLPSRMSWRRLSDVPKEAGMLPESLLLERMIRVMAKMWA